MKWRWQDVDSLPVDVYEALIAYLSEDEDGEVIDMDALTDGE